jgi:hypothetical protein
MFWLKNSFYSHLDPYIILGIREREKRRVVKNERGKRK